MDCLVSKYSYWHEEFNKSMVVIHQWLLQRYQTSKDSNLTFVDQKSQNYVIFMKSVWKRCKSNLNNNKNVNIPSRQCGQKKKCHFDIITEDPGGYFNEISVIRAFQRHHITLLVSKVEVILISAGSVYTIVFQFHVKIKQTGSIHISWPEVLTRAIQHIVHSTRDP